MGGVQYAETGELNSRFPNGNTLMDGQRHPDVTLTLTAEGYPGSAGCLVCYFYSVS
jgi:hypothetical protein